MPGHSYLVIFTRPGAAGGRSVREPPPPAAAPTDEHDGRRKTPTGHDTPQISAQANVKKWPKLVARFRYRALDVGAVQIWAEMHELKISGTKGTLATEDPRLLNLCRVLFAG